MAGDLIARIRAKGPSDAARGALRRARRELHGALRRRQLVRPLTVAPGELDAALGDDPVTLLRTRVLDALPTVRRWEQALDESLLPRADAVLAHRFDLLGSGPVELRTIDWQLDFKSGRRWPLAHWSRVPVTFPDDSDIKVPWELSRGQHLPILAAAWRVTGDRRYLDELGEQLDSWIDGNPVEFGANWLVAMEAAIRAANWVAALALVAEDAGGERWFRRALEGLLLHGRFIRSHLEDGPTRGNHYLSDIAGLLVLGALFSGDEGTAWLEFGAAALSTELEQQVMPDGVDHEVSIAYHRLVAELFVCGFQVVESLAPDALPGNHRARIEQMLEFTRDVTRADMLAPIVGDADDGRFLPLGDYGADPRSHLHLFQQAGLSPGPPAAEAAYADGGYYALRRGDAYLLIRCGTTGAGGAGWHAHNDQLSFELALGDQPLVIDPGTYVYTADPQARNLFRSTRSHATLAVSGAEQNELSTLDLFELKDRTHARCLSWQPPVFEGRHDGFPSLGGVRHVRRLELEPGRLLILDTILGAEGTALEWTFPLAGGEARLAEGGAEATIGDATLRLSGALDWSVDTGWYAPSYGVRIEVPYVRARGVSQEDETSAEILLEFKR